MRESLGLPNAPVTPEVLRSTILAGTVPAGPVDVKSELPPASDPRTPEPGWADRLFAAAAPQHATATPLPKPAAPDRDAPLHTLGVGDLLGAYAAGETDPVAVLAALRARIAAHPSGRDAVLASLASAEAAARDSAARWRTGTPRPLEGIPFGVKDIIDLAGAPVTCGSRLTGDRIAEADATVVARLKVAGAIPIAMLATTEYACGSAHNPRYGAVGNPWDPARWTGGSSTGSGAALAARLMPLALGTDTGGSIRVPAAFCGITGLKPTRGLVPRSGVTSLSWSLDHVGLMARSADDIALGMPAIAGPDGRDPHAVGAYDGARARPALDGLVVGVPGGWFVELQDGAVLDAWRAALAVLESLGARLVPVDLGEIATAHEDAYTAMMSELASLQEPDLDRMDLFDTGARARIEQGRTYRAVDYLRAMRRRPLVQQRILDAMAGVDVVVTPGLGCEAAALDTLTVEVDGERHPLQRIIPRNTAIFDYTGQPALMMPSGVGRSGMPVAVQVVGKPFDDALCLSVGSAFQRATAFHRRSPDAVGRLGSEELTMSAVRLE